MDAGYRPDHAIRKCKYAVSCIGEQIHGVVVLPFLNEAIPRSCPQVRVSRTLTARRLFLGQGRFRILAPLVINEFARNCIPTTIILG